MYKNIILYCRNFQLAICILVYLIMVAMSF